ncbi:MAG TPA: PRC-barrel domain-containing protein, partial [Paracoccus sp. (in: a-proteobacteria)]|nr:PRC-barrel domain-containing protein [Paracoccus sp. (in: a-proteobacteria)]
GVRTAAAATPTATVPATTVDSTTAVVTTPDAAAVTTTETVVAAPDVDAPVMSAENPGMLGSWIMKRRIWTTNQPSTTAWDANQTLTERPADWNDVAKIDDIVVDGDGNVTGYVADIGGFLGLGAKQVLLGKDALHLVRMNDDAFFVTNFTKEELEALPNFDTTTVMK